MADFNLLSSKTDLKKLFSKTEKFISAANSWQHSSEIVSNIARDNSSWQTVREDASIPTSFGLADEPAGYCRLDRQGHWLLRSPPPLLQRDASRVVTYYDRKRLSRDSNVPHTELTFPDSCEDSSISIDLHVPSEELVSDGSAHYGKKALLWRNPIRLHRARSSNDPDRSSR